jgi:hypothetical protein
VNVTGVAPEASAGLVSTIGVPLRNPFTNDAEFSVEPAIGANEDTNFDSGTEAVAGVGFVAVPEVELPVSAIVTLMFSRAKMRKARLM